MHLMHIGLDLDVDAIFFQAPLSQKIISKVLILLLADYSRGFVGSARTVDFFASFLPMEKFLLVQLQGIKLRLKLDHFGLK